MVLDKYIDVFDTKPYKSMIVKQVQLNVKEGSKPHVCYLCRPTSFHYRKTRMKVVKYLLDQNIIGRCGSSRRK